MMRFLLLCLLALPVLELASLFWLASTLGMWTWLYLLITTVVGVLLLKSLRLTFMASLMQSAQSGQSPIRSLLLGARQAVAGVLFLIPGVLTDVLGLLLLLPWPSHWLMKGAATFTAGSREGFGTYQANSEKEVFDAEYTHIDEDQPRLPPR